jgi:two-component system, OmpR family, phosphate regulon sensor histidine kinase PhoR
VSRSTLRIVIILAGLSIVGIGIIQVYWVRRAFDLRENQFNRDVNSALSSVATQIFQIHKTPSPFNNPVDQVSTNYFIVNINSPVENKLLEFLLVTEFEKRNITADFEYGVYDCIDNCMAGGKLVSHLKKTVALQGSLTQLPAMQNDVYYFGVLFPQLEANLISQMGIWSFSSAVLLIVIAFFVYTLFVILKQRRLSEIQKDFINNMTHEFKTPISTIALSTGVLKDPAIIHSPERLLSYATIIEVENQRLKQQVERVLQMASLDKEDIGLKKEIIDLHEIIREAASNMSLTLQESKGTINLDLEATRSKVSVDKLHFTNVFFNLLDNAIKYTNRAPEISIHTFSAGDKLHIEIRDNGLGISRENLKKIFHRFYRIPTGNVHNIKGFGLGLNYVKLIVESHGGKIDATSTPEKGSVFTITLPLL